MSLQLEETLPCMASCETNLNSSLQIWGWIIEKGKAEHLDEVGISGRLNGQTDIATGWRKKATAISAAQTGALSLSGSWATSHNLLGFHLAHPWGDLCDNMVQVSIKIPAIIATIGEFLTRKDKTICLSMKWKSFFSESKVSLDYNSLALK